MDREQARQELLRDLLSQVSRSFHLSLKWLPRAVRESISLAYLLARTSDTIADTGWIPADQRLAQLEAFAARIAGASAAPLDLRHLSTGPGDPAERRLLARAEDSLALLNELPDPDRRLVREVLATILSGQRLDLQRFADASESNLIALATAADLDDYTHRVAGCVGEFWTRVCWNNLTPRPDTAEAAMIALGIRYGQGLQLINVLRDLPRDLRQGRCYLPLDQLRAVSLEAHDLLKPETEPRLRPIYNAWLRKASDNLSAGWTYANAYPRALARIRISCALPILIGWRTLDRLKVNPVLNPTQRIKIPRTEVRGLVIRTLLCHPFPALWRRLPARRIFKAGADLK